ncbi:MAG: hypothetical protein H5U06_05710 [Candidatus Aminicenantes bacterium]|nr:hypothetical protein [Candidatus Aminicenantes bacterium]
MEIKTITEIGFSEGLNQNDDLNESWCNCSCTECTGCIDWVSLGCAATGGVIGAGLAVIGM